MSDKEAPFNCVSLPCSIFEGELCEIILIPVHTVRHIVVFVVVALSHNEG